MTQGIHHITMIAGNPQANVDFYAGTLGMRVVKVSVNQDDPGTYHFFYGDAKGSPGSDITFFPYEGGRQAMVGAGTVAEIRLTVPSGSMPFWENRFAENRIESQWDDDGFGTNRLRFFDHDGLGLSLQEAASGPGEAWPGMVIPVENAIKASIGVSILTNTGKDDSLDTKTGKFIEKYLGFAPSKESDRIRRYSAPDGSYIDVISEPRAPFGRGGHGGVHHVAFRVRTPEEQEEIHARLMEAGAHVSGIIDRLWFKSIYFREPGGVLFEIATDGPGFTTDEMFETLGQRLSLPPWLEPQRAEIEAGLPKIKYPTLETAR